MVLSLPTYDKRTKMSQPLKTASEGDFAKNLSTTVATRLWHFLFRQRFEIKLFLKSFYELLVAANALCDDLNNV